MSRGRDMAHADGSVTIGGVRMRRYYVATDAVHTTVDAISEDDAARIFAESEGIRGVEDKASLLDVVEAMGGWATVEEAIR